MNYMKKGLENHVESGNYIVFLPAGVQIPGYNTVPKIAVTNAGSERKAVSNVLFKKLSPKNARITMSKLDENYGGVQNYAVIIPEVDKKDRIYMDYLMAMELAAKDNSGDPEDYVGRARFLLRGIGKLPVKGVGCH